jgi:hypothetical protein
MSRGEAGGQGAQEFSEWFDSQVYLTPESRKEHRTTWRIAWRISRELMRKEIRKALRNIKD